MASLPEVYSFTDRSVIALVSKNSSSKINVNFFRKYLEGTRYADDLQHVEYPAKVERWDGGSEKSNYAVLTFGSKQGASFFSHWHRNNCLSLKLELETSPLTNPTRLKILSSTIVQEGNNLLIYKQVANMPAGCPKAEQMEAISRKRLIRDQQTFAQRSLVLHAADNEDVANSIRSKMSSARITVESLLFPVDGASIGLRQLGLCAVVTFGTSSEMEKAEKELMNNHRQAHRLPEQYFDSCTVFVPASTLEAMTKTTLHCQQAASIEDVLDMLRERFGVSIVYSPDHPSAGIQAHWVRVRAMCDFINAEVGGGEPLRLPTGIQTLRRTPESQGTSRESSPDTYPARKTPKIAKPVSRPHDSGIHDVDESSMRHSDYEDEREKRYSAPRRESPIDEEKQVTVIKRHQGSPARDVRPKDSNYDKARMTEEARRPDKQQQTGASPKTDNSDGEIDTFATCVSADDIDKLNDKAFAAMKTILEREELEKTMKQGGQGGMTSLPVPSSTTEPAPEKLAKSASPRRSQPLVKRVDAHRIVAQYLIERLNITKKLEDEYSGKITVELEEGKGVQFFEVQGLYDDRTNAAYDKLCAELLKAQRLLNQLDVRNRSKEMVEAVLCKVQEQHRDVFCIFQKNESCIYCIDEDSERFVHDIQRRLEEATADISGEKYKVPSSNLIAQYLVDTKKIIFYIEKNLPGVSVTVEDVHGSKFFVIRGSDEERKYAAYMKLLEEVKNAESQLQRIDVPHYEETIIVSALEGKAEVQRQAFTRYDKKEKCIFVIGEDASQHTKEIEHSLRNSAVTHARRSAPSTPDSSPQAPNSGDRNEPHSAEPAGASAAPFFLGGVAAADISGEKYKVQTSTVIVQYLVETQNIIFHIQNSLLGVRVTIEDVQGSKYFVIRGSDEARKNAAYVKILEEAKNAESRLHRIDVPQYEEPVIVSALEEEAEVQRETFTHYDKKEKCIFVIGEDASRHMKDIHLSLSKAALRHPRRDAPPTTDSSPQVTTILSSARPTALQGSPSATLSYGKSHESAAGPQAGGGAPVSLPARADAMVIPEPSPTAVPHKKHLYVTSEETWQYILACRSDKLEGYMQLFDVQISKGEKSERGLAISFTGDTADHVQSAYEAVSDLVDTCAKDFSVESFKVDLNLLDQVMLDQYKKKVLVAVDAERQKLKLKGLSHDVTEVKAKIRGDMRKLANGERTSSASPSPVEASRQSPSGQHYEAREKTYLASVQPSSSVASSASPMKEVPVGEDTWRYMRMCKTKDLERIQNRYAVAFKAVATDRGSPVIQVKGEDDENVSIAAESVANLVKKINDYLYIESIRYKELDEASVAEAVRNIITQNNVEIAFKVFEERKKVQLVGVEKDVCVCSQQLKRFIQEGPAAASQPPRARSLHEEPKQQPAEMPAVPPTSYKSALSDTFVHVIHRDITELKVDVIVNAANENLMHGGGVAAAIASAAGHELVQDCDEYMANVRRTMPIPVGDNYISVGGRLPCTYVMHAVGPMRGDYADEEGCQKDLQKTVFNCLRDASRRRLQSIALPAISSGLFGVPAETVAHGITEALESFLQQFERTSLRDIYFVDIVPLMVVLLQQNIEKLYILSAEPQYCGIDSTYKRPVSGSPLPQCAVCLEAIKDCKTLPDCQHSFCRECIEQVFRTGRRECPVCRKSYE